MFLAYEERPDGKKIVWTLEGNSGNRVRVQERAFETDFFTGLGHLKKAQLK